MSDKNNLTEPSTNLLTLGGSLDSIDLSNLPSETQDEIRKYAAMKQIDLAHSVQELQVDIQSTSASVGSMAETTRKMTESGDKVTIRQTIDNQAGKTEVLMGNTDEAKRGNVDASSETWMYIVGGVVVLIIVASVLG